MGFAISEVTYSPPLSGPMTYDNWMQATQSLDGCTEVRNIQWLYSLVSVQGDRSICVYQVPYTEALRQAYREAGVIFQQIWQPNGDTPTVPVAPNGLIIVVETSHGSYNSIDFPSKSASDFFAPSVVLTNDDRTLLLLHGTSVKDVESLCNRVNFPTISLWKANLIQPIL